MVHTERRRRPGLALSFAIAAVVTATAVGIVLALGAARLPAWPLVLFAFYFVTVAGARRDRLLVGAAGGLIGLTAGFAPGMIARATGVEALGGAALLAILVVLIAFAVRGAKAINPLCMLMLTCLTSFDGVAPPEAYPRAVASYAVGVALAAAATAVARVASSRQAAREGCGPRTSPAAERRRTGGSRLRRWPRSGQAQR
jgi:hypothetical protein